MYVYILTKLTERCLKSVLHVEEEKLRIAPATEVSDDVAKSPITPLFVISSIYILHICK